MALKKEFSFKSFWGKLGLFERCMFIAPSCLAIAAVIYIIATGGQQPGSDNLVQTEILLETEGEWESVPGSLGTELNVWVPTTMEEDNLDPEDSTYRRTFARRDKGNYPELAFGVIVSPNDDGRIFDLVNDPDTVLNEVTPQLTDAVAKMINGAQPSMAIDIVTTELVPGVPVLECRGEAAVTVLYQDPKDAENVWAEELSTNLYYNVAVINETPVVCWGIWDYSTYLGEEDTIASVQDAILSMMESETLRVVEPSMAPELEAE